jgi:hypothetical protein
MVGQASVDAQTIFVVADRQEMGWLFAAVAKYPEKVGKVRGTIFASNVIVTCLEDLPPEQRPKLAVKIDGGKLSEIMIESLTNAGFAVGFKAYTGVLRVWFDEVSGDPTRVWLEMPGEGVDLAIGSAGEEIRIALPVPEEDMPDLKLTGVKPKAAPAEKPDDQSEVPESGPPSITEPAVPDPARTEGKNVIDG